MMGPDLASGSSLRRPEHLPVQQRQQQTARGRGGTDNPSTVFVRIMGYYAQLCRRQDPVSASCHVAWMDHECHWWIQQPLSSAHHSGICARYSSDVRRRGRTRQLMVPHQVSTPPLSHVTRLFPPRLSWRNTAAVFPWGAMQLRQLAIASRAHSTLGSRSEEARCHLGTGLDVRRQQPEPLLLQVGHVPSEAPDIHSLVLAELSSVVFFSRRYCARLIGTCA
ncbi:hypothetical protein GGR56DRAFT_272048 [Xylariaceae sp. FL0804]|nr:hypothetical protein GGR56DRAFT_272048 [Xylariaceae sp. FL0804]